MMACPFGAITFDEESGKMRKCDLCDGDPACVKHCTTGAIQYITSAEACITKMVDVASKMNKTELTEDESTDFASKVG
jgi:Fe-S-cluster-containing dehydrogenase component